jgi:archaellum component FlaC
MTTLARIASALIAASAILFPLSAMAETKAPEGHRKGHESTYPMKADAFKKLVDGRIDRLKGHLEQGLEKRSLSSEQKAEIEKSMDGALKDLHSAVSKVSSDGTVTRDEAKQIKELSEQLRTKMRAELKGKHASAKTAGAKPAKGKTSKVKAASKKTAKEGFNPKEK